VYFIIFRIVFLFFKHQIKFLLLRFFFILYCLIKILIWSGGSFVVESLFNISFLILCLFVSRLVIFSEERSFLQRLRKIICLLCGGFFLSRRLLLFYFFFEIVLFPTIIIILFFGGRREKIRALYYFILYTTFCALPFFLLVLNQKRNFSYFQGTIRLEIGFIIILAFLMKLPVFLFHFWLPRAHVEAPTSASILLAGLLLKLGGVGVWRVIWVLKSFHLIGWIFLSLLGCFFASFIVSFQSDIKSLAAYSSIIHINFAFLGLILESFISVVSGFLIFILHGYLSRRIFYFIGSFFHVSGRRIVYFIKGLISRRIIFSFCFSWNLFSNGGIPPTLTFFLRCWGFFLVE